jgi:DNA-binding GntR family transcriptional regulator
MYVLRGAINSPVTRGEAVYEVLRAQLLNGVLNPGPAINCEWWSWRAASRRTSR